jgi:hypothetical protein
MPTFTIGNGIPYQTNGTYQQLLTIENPFKKGINTLGSNVEFTTLNQTLLYSWIQSINSSALQVWVKNYDNNSVINLEVLPAFENLLSPTGHLGKYGSTDNNFKMVFVNVTNIQYSLSFPFVAFSDIQFGDHYQFNYSERNYSMNLDMEEEGGQTRIATASTTNAGTVTSGGNPYSINYFLCGYNGKTYDEEPRKGSTTSAIPGNYYQTFISMQNGKNAYASVNYTGQSDYSFTNYAIPSGGKLAVNDAAYKYIYTSLSPATMPSYSIGSGQIFEANATTTSTLSGTPGQMYNSTYQYYTYQITLEPNTSFATLIWNKSWTLSNAYPSTFLAISSKNNFITFEDLSGFSSIQIQLIEPSSQINTEEQVQLSPYQEHTNESLVTYQSYFSLSVSYTPFQSRVSYTIQPSSMGFSLPYGSTATAYIYSPWHQLIGSAHFSIDSTFVQVNVPLDVTFAYFVDQQTNATFSGETLSANGYNSSYEDPMVVANGSSYSYSVSAINPQTYQLENYPGIFKASGNSQKIYIDVGMPLASALVNVYAFNNSGLDELGNGGPTTGQPTAYLYIGGVRQSLSSTFTGQLGKTYPVKITDVLGDVLYSGSLTLNQPSKTVNIFITKASYAVQFVNQEDVPSSSPLAIQHSSINLIGTKTYYNFTTRVGQESTIYLATGSYHLYTHDNLTNSLNFTISNETIGFDFNGPNILRITEAAINDTNHGLILIPISQPGNLIPGQNATWLFEVEFKNGTLLTSSEISHSTFQFIATNSSGFFLPEVFNHSIEKGYLRVTFLPTVSQSITFAMKESYKNNSGAYSYQVSVVPITPASRGLEETITVPSSVQEKNATIGTVFFSITSSKGSPATPNQAQTLAIMANTSLELLYKGRFDGLISIYYIQPGEGAFSLNISSTGTGYSVLAVTTPTNISAQKVSFTGSSSSFNVVSYNPTQQVSLTSQLEKALTGVDAEIFYLIVSVATVIYEIIKFARRKDEEEDTEDNEAGLYMEAMTMFEVLLLNAQKKPVPPELNEIYSSIPAKRRNRIYGLIISRRRAVLPKPKFLTKKSKKEVKDNE